MTTRKAQAKWTGGLKDGQGNVETESGAVKTAYSFPSRFETGTGSNPEELIGAAHAGCFAMAFSGDLEKAGLSPEWVTANASVQLDRVDGRPTITSIHLDVTASVPGAENEQFQRIATESKSGCPVSRALAAVEITVDAKLS